MTRGARSVQMVPVEQEQAVQAGNPEQCGPKKRPQSFRPASAFHQDAYQLWASGASLQRIADALGVKVHRVYWWSRREKWRELGERTLLRAQEKLIERQAEDISSIKLRHASIAKRGLTKVERHLEPDTDPSAFDLERLAGASERFVRIERVSRDISDPKPKESPLSEMLVMLLERIDTGRIPRSARVIEAESSRDLADPRDSLNLDGESRSPALPIRSETQRECGSDPRDAL